MNEILTGLFLGGQHDVLLFDRQFQDRNMILCVRNTWPDEEPSHAMWIPVVSAPEQYRYRTDTPLDVIRAHPRQLDLAALGIVEAMKSTFPILVHCREGYDRAPLVIVWYLWKYGNMPIDPAYKFVRSLRPGVNDRRGWLPQ